MDSIISTFHIDWKIVIAQLINFGIVITVLYLFALKPLKKLMSERTSKIETGVRDALTNAQMLEATKLEYEKSLAQARKEARIIFEESKKEAELKRAEMLEAAHKEVESMIEQGKKNLASEKSKMLSEAKKEIVSVVVQATAKLLETESSGIEEEKALAVLADI